MEVLAWLRKLGLEQYEPAFRENAIDSGVLPSLTSDDLREMGVGPIGHRRRLLDAIAALRSDSAREESVGANTQQRITQTPPLRDSAERRPITVMFCDLVGSTSLASKLDAEDWRDLVGAYLDDASKAVTQYGGHVLKKLGDGLMALFGYPHAQENDAERAAHAGLAILRALDDLNAKNAARGRPTLSVRIGLESGPVVVDATGEVFGDAPNVAARVQSAAEPGTLFVTAGVQRQVAGLFVAEDKGQYELKGVPGKPTLFRLARASGGGRRAGGRSLTPLVGREEELATLMRRWERAKASGGQFVQIVGEPGLGKSRLLEEFRARLVETPHTWVEWASSQLLQNTPLHPIAEWGRQRFVGKSRFAELEAALAQVKLDPAEHAPLLGPLLDTSLSGERAPQYAADEFRRRQLASVVAWLLAGARGQPLVLAFEDLHWADPTTLELIKTLAERGSQVALMIVATARSEFRAPWQTRSHHRVIALAPLDRAQIGQMVGAIAERHALSKAAIDGLTDRTAGVPLFIEELTRLMLEGGAQTIPPTLQQSLAARLDRLGDAREVAQIGAVLGREFSRSLLKAVAELPEAAIDAALERLADADLLFVEGIASAAPYRFKHALIRDAAYESLLRGRRQALHRRAADALLSSPDPQPELVAHHYTQSGQFDQAIEWWGKAGDVALRRNAFQEAISHLSKAVEMADQIHNDADPSRLRLTLQARLAQALSWGRGFAVDETKAAVESHATLVSGGSVSTSEKLNVLASQAALALTSGKVRDARALAEGCVHLAQTMESAEHTVSAYAGAGMVRLYLGDLSGAADYFRAALHLHDPSTSLQDRLMFYMDNGVMANVGLGLLLFCTGQIEPGFALLQQATDQAEVLGHLPTQLFAYLFGLRPLMERGEPKAVLRQTEALVARASAAGVASYVITAPVYTGWARARLGSLASGIGECRTAVIERMESGNLLGLPSQLSYLAELESEADESNEALAHLDEAERLMETSGECLIASRLSRVRGDVCVRKCAGDNPAAEAAYRKAIEIARKQAARTFELQGALPLARLLRSNNRCLEAYEVLRPALDGFSPTAQFPLIAEAQALLAALDDIER